MTKIEQFEAFIIDKFIDGLAEQIKETKRIMAHYPSLPEVFNDWDEWKQARQYVIKYLMDNPAFYAYTHPHNPVMQEGKEEKGHIFNDLGYCVKCGYVSRCDERDEAECTLVTNTHPIGSPPPPSPRSQPSNDMDTHSMNIL